MRQSILINALGDPRIDGYRQIKERDLVGRRGEFIAEGEVVLRTLIKAAPWRIESVLLTQRQAERLQPLLDGLPDKVARYVAPQALMDQIVGFQIHRGILALGRRGPRLDPDALLAGLGERAMVVVLCGIGNHDNMGGIFRNAAAFGADGVLLDSTCCDPVYRKAIRVSVGASLTTPFAVLEAKGDILALLDRHGFEALAFSPSGTARLRDVRRGNRVAVLLGAEGPGLSAELMARSRTVSIEMASDLDSLNVATTCGIALHHLTT
jgi:tRNA G18 (ribose-2'-O)-methylase SpoU